MPPSVAHPCSVAAAGNASPGDTARELSAPAPLRPSAPRRSGSVCLDVINQTWSPMFELLNVFESFLPQLLLYPNPTDPLNGEAASLLMREPALYNAKVKGERSVPRRRARAAPLPAHLRSTPALRASCAEYVARYAQEASFDVEHSKRATTTEDTDEEDAMSYVSDGSDSL